MAFQPINPEQLKDYLTSNFPNRKPFIQKLNIKSCGPHCLYFYSNTGKVFQIKIDPFITKPEIYSFPSSKTLKVPSMDRLTKNPNYLNRWLDGHEIRPDTHTTPKTQHTPHAQETFFKTVKQVLSEKAQSFLNITPTRADNALATAQVLKEKLQNYRKGKISFVTTHKTRLVDQLFDAIQSKLKGMDVTVIKWNENLNTDFYLDITRSFARTQPTVFVITSQSLKSWLAFLQYEKVEDYNRLIEHMDGMYIHEAYYLSVFYTKSDISILQEESGAFRYVTTATSAYKEFTDILTKKGIMSSSEWKKQRKTDPKLKHFPEHLYIANKGWTEIKARNHTQTGKGKPIYADFIEILLRKDITSKSKWEEQIKIDPELKHFPKYLPNTYKEWRQNGGWEYVRQKAGKGKPTYKDFIEILLRKNIMSKPEWAKQRETDPELKHIPKDPHRIYKEWGQNGGWKYVRKRISERINESKK